MVGVLSFSVGFLSGVGISAILFFFTKSQNTDLNLAKQGPIIKAGQLRSTKPKRIPRANTDLTAYLNEIREQGENRG